MGSMDSGIRGKVDVIIPAYEAEAFIRRAMDSVRLQGETVNQVFIVDNASADGTSEVVQRYIDEHGLAHWKLMHESRKGAPAARNHPLDEVTAEWIQFLDADDELLNEKLERQVRLADLHGSDVVVGASSHVNAEGVSMDKEPEREVRLALIAGRCGITSSNLFRSRSVREVHGWDETLSSSQEYDLMFRLWQKGAKFTVSSEPMTRIHERPSGRITTSNLPQKWRNHCAVQRRMLEAFVKTGHAALELNDWLQAHFSCIRILYQYDSEKALRFWRIADFAGFVPEVNSTNSGAYVRLFRWLGFEGAERVRRTLKRLTS